MKRIVFYTEPEWAFGTIHYELTKYLFQHDINSTVVPWNVAYTNQEITELSDAIDYFVSTPFGVAILIDRYNIKPEQCIAVAHAVLDLQCLKTFLPSNVTRLHNYSAVSEWLVEQSILLDIERVPLLTPIGINYNAFCTTPSKELQIVGYAGAINSDNIHRHIKRHWLVTEATQLAQLKFKAAHGYHNSFTTMPGFYTAVDAVLVSSTEEGAGLPALEASAAGKLVISTPVGLWLSKSNGSGHTVPIEEREFVNQTTLLLNYYKNNSSAYRQKCLETQEHAKLYDWSNVISTWVDLIK